MDTNDFRPLGSETKNNNQVESEDHSSYNTERIENSQPMQTNAQTGYSQAYNNTNPGYQQVVHNNPNNPRRKGVGGILLTVIMLLCLVVGGVVTAFVIMPAINNGGFDVAMIDTSAEPEKSGLQAQPQEDITAPIVQQEAQEALTTDSPDIGGQAPQINLSENPIVQIAQEVGPAIVGVTISMDQITMDQEVTQQEVGYGTGIILSEDGYIVTNNHVIENSNSVKITLYDGTEYTASIVGADATTDIAVLKIDAIGLTAAALGDSDSLQVGETAVAIGNPLGSELAGSVTSGIISALNREISTNGYSQKYIQTDAAINPGNSGGALVNMQGQVIGINTLKSYLAGYDDYGMPIGTEGIGFAIPISDAKPIIEQLMTDGNVERPGIGISCLVDVSNAYNPSGSPEGVTVVEVVVEGPANLAGLQPNDIIVSLEGTAVGTVEELTNIIKSHKAGDKLDMTVWREGQEYRAKVTVGDLNDMG